MARYTFITHDRRWTAENEQEAIALCRRGVIPLDAQLVIATSLGDKSQPLNHHTAFFEAASHVQGIVPPSRRGFPLFGLSMVTAGGLCVVCAIAVAFGDLGPDKDVWYRIKAVIGFAIFGSIFVGAYFRDSRSRA